MDTFWLHKRLPQPSKKHFSAISTAFSAAPRSSWSPQTNKSIPQSKTRDWRRRPTCTTVRPLAVRGIGYLPWGGMTSIRSRVMGGASYSSVRTLHHLACTLRRSEQPQAGDAQTTVCKTCQYLLPTAPVQPMIPTVIPREEA